PAPAPGGLGTGPDPPRATRTISAWDPHSTAGHGRHGAWVSGPRPDGTGGCRDLRRAIVRGRIRRSAALRPGSGPPRRTRPARTPPRDRSRPAGRGFRTAARPPNPAPPS